MPNRIVVKAVIGGDTQNERQVDSDAPVGQRLRNPKREECTADPAEQSEDQVFGEQLANEAAASCADGESDGGLLAAIGSAGQQHAREVRTRDQEHHRGQTEQRGSERNHRTADHGAGESGRRKHDFHAAVIFGILFGELMGDARERGFRLGRGDAGREAGDGEDVAGATPFEIARAAFEILLHVHGEEDLGHVEQFGSPEFAGKDADDGVVLTIDLDGLADRVWIASQPLFPARVSEDGEGMRAFLDVVFRREQAPERGFHAEHLEVVAGDEVAPDSLAFAAVAETGGQEAVSGDAGQHGVATVADVAIVGIGKSGKGVASDHGVDRHQSRTVNDR
jgi:hypothetical protein